MLTYIAYIIFGLGFLAWSADKLVEYAVSLANHLGVTPFFIGIVIIGFGTSAPEMLISALAALDDTGGLAVGNAIGSNIANIGLVLGSVALIAPLALSKKILKFDLTVLFIITLVAVGLMLDKHISFMDGAILILLLVGFLVWSALSNMSDDQDDELKDDNIPLAKSVIWTLASLAILLGSSKLLLTGAVGICDELGISELIVGLTVIAIGTSLPELAASIAAAKQKQSGMIIGNILGSNAFNTLGVLGIVGLLSDTTISSEVLYRDWAVLITIMVLLTILAVKKGKLATLAGTLLLSSYLGYLGYLIIQTIG